MRRIDSWEKTLMLGDWRQEEEGATEDETVGWCHWLNGHEFEQTQGDSEGQGSLGWCSSWGFKESDKTERLSNNATKQAATLGFDSRASSSMALCLCNTGLNIPNPTSHTVFFLGVVEGVEIKGEIVNFSICLSNVWYTLGKVQRIFYETSGKTSASVWGDQVPSLQGSWWLGSRPRKVAFLGIG